MFLISSIGHILPCIKCKYTRHLQERNIMINTEELGAAIGNAIRVPVINSTVRRTSFANATKS